MNQTRLFKFGAWLLIAILVIYGSLDIQKLDKHRASAISTRFDATEYAAKFWNDALPNCVSTAPQIVDVLNGLNENPPTAFGQFGKKLGITKTGYFLVSGKGKIEKVEEEYILVALDEKTKIKIATDYIFGNAVRDGSGKVNIDEFLNMTDFNAVSVAINKLVKDKVVARLKNSAAEGKWLEFTGAFEMNEENADLSGLLIIPVAIQISDGKS